LSNFVIPESGPNGQQQQEPPEYLPNLVYEPRMEGDAHTFGYVQYDCRRSSTVKGNTGSNRAGIRPEPIRFLELFGGAGGMHRGLAAQPGFQPALMVESDPSAVQTFTSNHSNSHQSSSSPVLQMDVVAFLHKCERNDRYRESIGKIHMVHSSSPCQGFSKANRSTNGGTYNEKAEANNELAWTFQRAVKLFQPLVATFENVEGMWDASKLRYLEKMCRDLIRMRYQVRCTVLRACVYGSAQIRPRVILFAARDFVQPMPSSFPPPPTHGNPSSNDNDNDNGRDRRRPLDPYVSCQDVLDSLRRSFDKDQLPNHSRWDCRKVPVAPPPQTQQQEEQQHVNVQNFVQLRDQSLVPTIRANGPPVLHYDEPRCVTVREAAALQ